MIFASSLWGLYHLGWMLYDVTLLARGYWYAIIPLLLGASWFFLRRRV